jgi:hypothetical protein
MRHIFFAFPAGAPGVALVLFRISAAVWITGAGGRMFIPDDRMNWLSLLASFGFVVGVPTRVISGTCAVFAVLVTIRSPAYPLACSGAFVLSMLALTLIGPGAYSVDALLFGRRTVRFPG